MSSDDSSSVVCVKYRTVGGVDSEVGLNTVELELVVLGGFNLGFLSGDLNALDGYKGRLENGKSFITLSFSVLEDLGDINRSNRSDFGGLDLCGSTLDFVSVRVDSLKTGDFNGHTNLDAKISNGVFFHAVSVVAAVSILNVKVVVLAACSLRGSCSNNTNYNNSVAVLSCDVVCIRHNFVLGNLAVVGLGYSVTCIVRNGSSKCVSNILIGLNGELNSVNTVILAYDGNLVRAGLPGYGVEGIVDLYFTNYIVVAGGKLCFVLVKRVEIFGSLCKTGVFFILATCGKDTKAKDSNQKKRE